MQPFDPTRRGFLASAGVFLLPAGLFAADAPTDDPIAGYKLEWTKQMKWAVVVDATRMKGDTPDEQLAAAQAVVAAKGGGLSPSVMPVCTKPGTTLTTRSPRAAKRWSIASR